MIDVVYVLAINQAHIPHHCHQWCHHRRMKNYLVNAGGKKGTKRAITKDEKTHIESFETVPEIQIQ